MEPLDDKELDALLRKWEAPPAPASLRAKVVPPSQWWQWLTRGTIRVPVPAGIALILALAAFLYFFRTPAAEQPTPIQAAKSVSLADFQPVKQLEPRVIRRGNEGN